MGLIHIRALESIQSLSRTLLTVIVLLYIIVSLLACVLMSFRLLVGMMDHRFPIGSPSNKTMPGKQKVAYSMLEKSVLKPIMEPGQFLA